MKSDYLQLFVCRKFLLSILLCVAFIPGFAQPPCGSVTIGKITASAVKDICPGTDITFSLTSNTTDPSILFFLQRASSLSDPFNVTAPPSWDPFNTPMSAAAVGGTSYYRIVGQCLYTGAAIVISDTIEVDGGMYGYYTINALLPETGRNFASFGSAVEKLKSVCVGGPIVFDVTTTGYTYNEQVAIPELNGTSDVNTVTFNCNGNTLTYSGADANSKYIVKLDGADHIIFDSLQINATAGKAGYGFVLLNDADNNTIRRCVINAGQNATSSDYACIIVSAVDNNAEWTGSYCDDNVFENNTLIGGRYGISLTGDGDRNKIRNNNIRDAYRSGIQVIQTNETEITGNLISNPKRISLSYFTAIEVSNNSNSIRVTDNRISNLSGANTASGALMYGISFSSADADISSPNIVANNLIYGFNGSGQNIGLYNGSSDNVHYYHNTIFFDTSGHQTSTDPSAGIFFNTYADGVEFKNNIIVMLRDGSGVKYGIYKYYDQVAVTSDNNDIYMLPVSSHYVGYAGTGLQSLSAWQSKTGSDLASVVIDPQFLNAKEGNLKPNNTVLDNLGVYVGVDDDVDAVARDGSTPDLGAYEFNYLTCSTPPAAATVAIAQNPVCSAASARLTASGGELGAGLTYQWQSSVDNQNWADVASANSRELNVAQTTNTWYRLVTTCGTSNTPSDAVQLNVVANMSGKYTINKAVATGGRNFQSFTDAWNAVQCGINGAVELAVAPGSGPYNEQLITAAVPGASAVNTITINGNGNTLYYLSDNTNQRAVVKLNGTDHLIIDSLIIKATGASPMYYGLGIQIMNDADSNIIRKCAVYTDTTLTIYDHGYGAIAIASAEFSPEYGDAFSDYNTIEDNTVVGGLYGITNTGNATKANSHNIIRRNKVLNFLTAGIYSNNAIYTVIDSNIISRPTRTSVDVFNGIYLTGGQAFNTISRNVITNPFGGQPDASYDFYGIHLEAADAGSGSETVISNNIIYNVTGTGNTYGFYNYTSDGAWFYHNTVHLDGTGNYDAYAFYQTSAAANIRLRNNIITISRAGDGKKYAMYYGTPSSTIISDYNDYYITTDATNAFVGFRSNLDRKFLADWQVASNDINSISVDPLYTNVQVGNLKPLSGGTDNLGLGALPVLNDVAGIVRSATHPDMGAYEYTATPCATAVAGAATANDDEICEGTKLELNISGNSTGGEQTYQWQAATTETGSYAAIGNVQTTPIFITLPGTNAVYYRAAVTCKGATVYTQPVTVNVNAMLAAGVYTIDQNGTGDFKSFNEAKAALRCGIKGPVVFNVLPGGKAYEEQLVLDSIPGASAVNTVTFKGNGDTIRYSSTDYDVPAVITLQKTDYVTFDSLVISAEGEGYYGLGIYITNSADNNTIQNCKIIIPQTSGSSSYNGIIINGSTSPDSYTNSYCDNNLLKNNTITGGYCGISMLSGWYSAHTGNKAIGNTIQDFYSYGIMVGASVSTVIEGNNISRPTRTSIDRFYGIYLNGESSYPSTGNHAIQVSKNRIHNVAGGSPSFSQEAYGIYINSNAAYSYAVNTVSNNLIYDFNGSGTQYGIYMWSSSNIRYYHNTISLDNKNYTGAAAAYGLYSYLSASAVDIKNNIITVLRGGTGVRYGLYFQNGSSSFTSDFNDIWVNTGVNKFVGHYGADFASLTNWKGISIPNTDAHSVSFDPAYTDTSKGNYVSSLPALDNTGAPVGITTDINGVARNTSAPDLGAYEYNSSVCTSPPTPGVAVADPNSGICMGKDVQLSLTGSSVGGGQKYLWQRAASDAGPWTTISDSLSASTFDYTLENKETYFRAAVVCGTGVAYSTAAQVTLNGGLLAGDYTIDPSLPSGSGNFQSFGEAIAAMSCGIEGSVRFLVVPGTYSERVRVPKIPGASATATVTFLSKNNDAATTIVTAVTTSDSNYVVKLDTTNYIIFKNLTIQPGGVDFARAVEITGTSSHDSITGCVMNLPVVHSTSLDVIGIYGQDLYGEQNVFTKNTITNGRSGIYLFGVPGYSTKYVIDSNTVNYAYASNIFAQNIGGVSVSGNTVEKYGIQDVFSYGIWIQKCDSAYAVNNNHVTITYTASRVLGIVVFVSDGGTGKKGSVSNNVILADSTNSGDMNGLVAYTGAANFTAKNNVVVIGSKGAEAIGINHQSSGVGNAFYNNSVQIESATANSFAASFSNYVSAYNNILSNIGGGGAAIRMANNITNGVDYNLFYSSGPALALFNGTTVTSLQQWQKLINQDYNSLVYKPVFADKKLLTPDIANAEVWAMHGRGVQLEASNVDFNGKMRPVTLETGVPDLGAYEFTPTVAPVSLTATPAVPQANSKQTFMLGTDTVTVINWGSTVPSTIEGKRYSGVAPEGLATNQPFMYFYTSFATTGTAPKGHAVKQYYVDSWTGTIENEKTIKLGKTNAAAAWEISANSKLDTIGNTVADTGLTVLAKFTGLTDGKEAPTNPVTITPRDTSNRGTMFWAPYASTVLFQRDNSQDMVFYLGAGSKPATVTVRINGTTWQRVYNIPANTAITSDLIPKSGIFDARLLTEGMYDRGISIQSDVEIAAYAHIYGPSASAATMLMPVGTYGYEYYALTPRQTYNPTLGNASVVAVIAAYDSTVVEITPSVPTQGHPANTPFTVLLSKGEVYQVLGAIDLVQEKAYDLTGTKIRSIKNVNGKCWPIAVFSGSSLTGFDCSMTGDGGTGDNVLQQNFPYQAWGKKYLTAPTSHYTDAKQLLTNVFRVYVKDPNTHVELNGAAMGGLVDGKYYQYASATADYINADKPVLVAQFQPSTHMCGVTDSMGDPEMFFISPIEQGVKDAQLYRNTTSQVVVQFLTLIVPTKALGSLKVDGANSWDYAYPHPNLAGYTVVVVRWIASKGQTLVKCDSAFTGITYGMGAFESYGYNAGAMVLNLNTKVSMSNTLSPSGGYTDYTCAGTPFKLSLMTTVEPTAIDWQLSSVAQLTPHTDVHIDNPKAVDTIVINGVTYYQYALDQQYVANAAGTYNISAFITHPDIDACDSRQETIVPITVLAAPVVDFTFDGTCLGTATQFAGSAELTNNAAVATWTYDFNEAGAMAYSKDTVHTYKNADTFQVKLSVVDANGCVGDTVKPVIINASLAAPIVKVGTIASNSVTFVWAAIPGATGYEVSLDNGTTWIAPSGTDGLSHTVSGLDLGVTVTIKVRVLGSCVPAVSDAVSATTAVQEVYIPNSFSPDHNGLEENEYFKVYGNSIKQLRLMIFNQWGEKLFETTDKSIGWDGTYKGKPQPSGVYIYAVDILLNNNKRETKKGTINLVR